jgi:hypothetical protein
MGFSEAVYTGIPDMINNYLATNKTPNKSQEDEIVASLMEEMLSYSPPKSQVSLL